MIDTFVTKKKTCKNPFKVTLYRNVVKRQVLILKKNEHIRVVNAIIYS